MRLRLQDERRILMRGLLVLMRVSERYSAKRRDADMLLRDGVIAPPYAATLLRRYCLIRQTYAASAPAAAATRAILMLRRLPPLRHVVADAATLMLLG